MRHIVRQFKGQDHTPAIQFVKYGIAGVVSTVVHVSCFYILACKVLPAISQNDHIARLLNLSFDHVPDGIRARNAMIDNTVAFLFSNLTAYLLNIWWVFKSGRHHRFLEVLYFYLVSGLSIVIGSALMGVLIHSFGLTTTAAFFVNVVVALMINFLMRKHFVFDG